MTHRQSNSRIASLSLGFFMPLKAAFWLWRTNGVKRFGVLPLIANVLLYSLVIYLFIGLLISWDPEVGPWEFWGGAGEWLARTLNAITTGLKWIIGLPLILLGCYFTFTSVGMIIASPFNDLLSDRVERKLCEAPGDGGLSWALTSKILMRSLWGTICTSVKQLFFVLVTLPFLLVPLVGILPLLLVTAYFTGLSLVEISLSRHNLAGRAKNVVFKNHFWELLGLGMGMELLFYIPLLGLALLPLGVTAGTMLYTDLKWDEVIQAEPESFPDHFSMPKRLNVA